MQWNSFCYSLTEGPHQLLAVKCQCSWNPPCPVHHSQPVAASESVCNHKLPCGLPLVSLQTNILLIIASTSKLLNKNQKQKTKRNPKTKTTTKQTQRTPKDKCTGFMEADKQFFPQTNLSITLQLPLNPLKGFGHAETPSCSFYYWVSHLLIFFELMMQVLLFLLQIIPEIAVQFACGHTVSTDLNTISDKL